MSQRSSIKALYLPSRTLIIGLEFGVGASGGPLSVITK